MDIAFGVEYDFCDGQSRKPERTFGVNSNAPLHSNGFKVPPSGGIVTFPENKSFSDRFILWRTDARKLYLEERSMMASIAVGSLCIDFSRTSILPGTSITIFEENILSLVVPTQSTIHRFYARLHLNRAFDTSGVLASISQDDFFKFHSSHPLTIGTPIRASITQHQNKNLIGYCSHEGHLVIVSLNSYHDEKHEEFVLRDGSFMKRLIGGPNPISEAVADVCLVRRSRERRYDDNGQAIIEPHLRGTPMAYQNADIAFAVTKNGWLRGWNIETQKVTTNAIDLKKRTIFLNEQIKSSRFGDDDSDVDDRRLDDENGELVSYTIKSYPMEETSFLLVIAATSEDESVGSTFHLVKAQKDQLTYLKSLYHQSKDNEERLMDFVVVRTEPSNGRNGGSGGVVDDDVSGNDGGVETEEEGTASGESESDDDDDADETLVVDMDDDQNNENDDDEDDDEDDVEEGFTVLKKSGRTARRIRPTMERQSQEVPANAWTVSLTVMWHMPAQATKKDYVLRRIVVGIDLESATCMTRFAWHEVNRFDASPLSSSTSFTGSTRVADSDSEASSAMAAANGGVAASSHLPPLDAPIEELRDAVFNVDNYPFNVVLRAVQVVCEGSICEVRNGSWLDLAKHVEVYLDSVEVLKLQSSLELVEVLTMGFQFNRNYQRRTDRGLRLRTGAEDLIAAAQQKFWWALIHACDELLFAARGPVGMAAIQLQNDVRLTAVIHRDRVTLVREVEQSLFDELAGPEVHGKRALDITRHKKELITKMKEATAIAESRLRLMNRERCLEMGNDEAMGQNGLMTSADLEADGPTIRIPLEHYPTILRLADAFLKFAEYDIHTIGSQSRCLFNGSFVTSVLSANIRVIVTQRLIFAYVLRSLVSGAFSSKMSARMTTTTAILKRKEDVESELRENKYAEVFRRLANVVSEYREVAEQLDVKIIKNGAKMSLCSWLPADIEGIIMMQNEGAYKVRAHKQQQVAGLIDVNFNGFLDETTQSTVRALLPSSESFLLAKRLIGNRQYRILKMVMNEYTTETSKLRPAIMFYRGIAFSGTDHPSKAMEAFTEASQGFVEGNRALRRAVVALLPRSLAPNPSHPSQALLDQLTLAEYYLTVVKFLQDHDHGEEVVNVTIHAIDTLPANNESVRRMSNTLFNHLTKRNEWSKALRLIVKTTSEGEQRRASVCELLSLMLKAGEWECLATMIYGSMEEIVEDFLRDAANRQNPSEKRHLYELLFAFFMVRREFRQAACVMYEYARYIQSAPEMTMDLLKRRRDALAAVLNLQSVLSIEPDDGDDTLDDYQDTALVFPLADNDIDDDEEMDVGRQQRAALAERVANQPSTPSSTPTPAYSSTPSNSNSNSNSNSSGKSNANNSAEMSTGIKLLALKERIAAEAVGSDGGGAATSTTDVDEMEHSGGSGSGKENEMIVGLGKRKPLPAVPERRLSPGTVCKQLAKRRRVVIIEEHQVREEWLLTTARVALLAAPTFDGVPPMEPEELEKALIEQQLFDVAFDIARQFGLSAYGLMFALTRDAIVMDAVGDRQAVDAAGLHTWVRTNRRHAEMLGSSGDHWSIVRGLLLAARSEWPTDSRPLRGATEAFLAHQLPPPCWLHNEFLGHDANDYLRCLVDFDQLTTALQVANDVIDAETKTVTSADVRTWLPYDVLDEMLRCSKEFVEKSPKSRLQQQTSDELNTLLQMVEEKLSAYQRRVESHEKAFILGQKTAFSKR